MKRLSRPACAVLAALLFAGCSHLSIPFIGKKRVPERTDPAKPKESTLLATEMEKEFKQRWMDKRVNELVGQGVSPESARTQANDEFRQKYSITNAAHQ